MLRFTLNVWPPQLNARVVRQRGLRGCLDSEVSLEDDGGGRWAFGSHRLQLADGDLGCLGKAKAPGIVAQPDNRGDTSGRRVSRGGESRGSVGRAYRLQSRRCPAVSTSQCAIDVAEPDGPEPDRIWFRRSVRRSRSSCLTRRCNCRGRIVLRLTSTLCRDAAGFARSLRDHGTIDLQRGAWPRS